MKTGDLVEFTYGRVAGQIGGLGVLAELGTDGKHKVLFMGKGYWVPASCIKRISMVRMSDVNKPLDN